MVEEVFLSVLRYKISYLFLLSAFLFGQDRIFFPHGFHVEDQEIECSTCHAGVEESSTVSNRYMPTMDTCADCHDVDDDCSMCHMDENEEYLPLSESLPTSGMNFPHNTHLKKISDCATCHSHILEDDGEEVYPVWNQKDCKACHTKTKPGSHNDFWVSGHGLSVSSYSLDGCAQCHASSTCDQCHQYQQFEPRVHGSDYLYNHSFDFKSGAMECTSCHDIARDCQSCHRDNNVWPADHNQSNWATMMNDGGLHGEAAENEPDVCQACHQIESATNTCLRSGCHVQ